MGCGKEPLLCRFQSPFIFSDEVDLSECVRRKLLEGARVGPIAIRLWRRRQRLRQRFWNMIKK